MTKLLFVRQAKVYLPEIAAYKKYLEARYPHVEIKQSTDVQSYNPKDYDILWYFMGANIVRKANYIVHEYNSASTPPYASTKNFIKKIINTKPNQRIFLNKTVKEAFCFKDNVPEYLRDMGIDPAFFKTKKPKSPEYDFIMVGGLDRGDSINKILGYISEKTPELNLLIVGEVPSNLAKAYQDAKNIIFYGRVAYDQVPELMASAKYGLNIMPDMHPFNAQTSTKAIEYCAVGLPLITTDYKWINQFEKQAAAQFFKLNSDFSNLTVQNLREYAFKTPDMSGYDWNKVIERSGIFSFLKA